jgi:hypothetical protein
MDARVTAPATKQVSPFNFIFLFVHLLFLFRLELVSARWCLLPPAIVAFLRGALHTYEVFDWVWVAVSVLVVLRIGSRYY